MNQDKARDLFSAYYEDVLDGGLKHSFEQQLRTDAVLQADYAAFVETIRELDALKHEEIEIPIYLSDRIATRLEQVQDKRRFGLPVWTTWIRGLALAGLAVVAITATLPLFNSDKSVTVGGFSGAGTMDQLMFKADGSNVVLNYQPSSPKTVVVSSPLNGKEVKRFKLDGQRLQSPISNPLQTPAIFKVEVIDDHKASTLVIPGQLVSKAKSGDGSVRDLAMALSGYYRVPVVIEAADVTKHVTWNFGSTDALTAATQAVSNDGFSVDQRPDGIIKILDR